MWAIAAGPVVARQSDEEVHALVERMEQEFWEAAPQLLIALEKLLDSPDAPIYLRENPTAASRDLQSALEACVARLGFTNEIRTKPTKGGYFVEIEVTNTISVPITGIVVEISDPKLSRLGLGGETPFEFDTLEPGEVWFFSEEVLSNGTVFSEEKVLPATIKDVFDSSGTRVISNIFESRYPGISSMEEFEFAIKTLCEMP